VPGNYQVLEAGTGICSIPPLLAHTAMTRMATMTRTVMIVFDVRGALSKIGFLLAVTQAI
jgi:hypothetical protein